MTPQRPPVLAFAPALTLASFRRVLVSRGGGARGSGGALAFAASQSRSILRPPATPLTASTVPSTPTVAADAAAAAVTPTPTTTCSIPATHIVTYRGRRFPVEHGTTLRTALIRAGASPHNGRSTVICCRGLGTCGTCAVAVVADHGDDGGSGDGIHDGGGAAAAVATTPVAADVAAASATTPVDGTATSPPPPPPPVPPPAVTPGLSPPSPSARERARLAFPPHTAATSAAGGLRLACQVRVVGDVAVAKGEGFWGHRPARLPPLPTPTEAGETG